MADPQTYTNSTESSSNNRIPTVSIGMPVYNGRKYIREALDSLLSQTFSDFELIISDNASSDGTDLIFQEYSAKDPRIKYVRQKENFGALANFEFVLNQSRGQYFMWAAFDDKWDEKWVEVMLKGMIKPNTVLCFGSVVVIDVDANVIRRCKVFDYSGPRTMRLAKYFISEDYSGKACVIYGLYRTSFLKEIEPLKEYTAGIFSDMQFVFNCLQYGEINIVPEVVFYKRMAPVSAVPKSPWKILLKSVLLVDSAKSLVGYVALPTHLIDKIIVLMLVPLKYLKAVVYNALRYFNRIKE